MSHPLPALSLAHLTLLSLSPPELIRVAAETGYQHVGLRLLPSSPQGPAWPLMDDPVMLKETLAASRDTGVTAFDLEIVRLLPDIHVPALQPFFEVGQQLGAKAILVGCDDPDPVRRAQNFAALCEAALPYGLAPCIEFMPWMAVGHLHQAAALIRDAGEPANAGLLIDALHWARSISPLSAVKTLPKQWLRYAQVCDAPAQAPDTVDGLIHAARCERLLPGEGGIGLVSLLQALPLDVPLSVEVPDPKRVEAMGACAWARQALEGALACHQQR